VTKVLNVSSLPCGRFRIFEAADLHGLVGGSATGHEASMLAIVACAHSGTLGAVWLPCIGHGVTVEEKDCRALLLGTFQLKR